MKPGDDKELSAALGGWKVEAPLPPGLREKVWRRIAEVEASRWGPLVRWSAWLDLAFGRRSFIVSYVSALVVLGLFAGLWHGRSQQRHVEAQLAERYVESVASHQRLP
jgi:hypothetical protein